MLSVTHNEASSKLLLDNKIGMSKNKMWLVVLFFYLMLDWDGHLAQGGPTTMSLTGIGTESLWLTFTIVWRWKVGRLRSYRAVIICVQGKAKEARLQVEQKWETCTERNWDERLWSHWGANGTNVMAWQFHSFTSCSYWNGAILSVLKLWDTYISPPLTASFSLRQFEWVSLTQTISNIVTHSLMGCSKDQMSRCNMRLALCKL